ncbi:MAG: acyltransferase family protein [Pseudomonadota bacterium]
MADLALKPETFNSQSRVDWVDYAKGFCILFVVMMHSTLGVEKHAFESGLVSEGTTGWMNTIVTFAQPFRMPDFFLLSGLFLGLVIGRSWLRYFDRKVVHFFYFYILWLVIQFAFRSIGWVSDGLGPAEIIGKFGVALIEPYGTLWFIYMLPVMFLVTRLLTNVHWLLVLCVAAGMEIAPVQTNSVLIDEFAARYVYFFAGYALAVPIFRLAGWAKDNVGLASAYLTVWAVINGWFTLAPLPQWTSDLYASFAKPDPMSLSQIPFVSLTLGSAGAVAVICLCAILSKLKFTSALRYLGQNSIVIYLAFFLPMIVTREILFRFAPGLDLGTMSLTVLMVSVASSVIAFEFTRITGWLSFLFLRPRWAWIDRKGRQAKAAIAVQPAE